MDLVNTESFTPARTTKREDTISQFPAEQDPQPADNKNSQIQIYLHLNCSVNC